MKIKTAILILCAALSTFADTEVVNGITWTYTVENDEVSLGAVDDKGTYLTAVPKSTTGEIVIPSKLKGRPVVKIGRAAFFGCGKLTGVTVPPSIVSVDANAFGQCFGLIKVNISDIGAWSSIAFAEVYSNPLAYAKRLYLNGKMMTDLLLLDTVDIGDYAFYSLASISNLTIGGAVKRVGREAFAYCNGLTNVTFEVGITNIGYCAFFYCSGIDRLFMPESVENIDSGAFAYCESLRHVTIPDDIMNIGKDAFMRCNPALYDVKTIPGLKLVDGWVIGVADYDLTGIINLDGTRGIGNYAFSGCNSLSGVIVPTGVTCLGNEEYHEKYTLGRTLYPSSVRSVYLPKSYSGGTAMFPAKASVYRYKPLQNVLLNSNGGFVSPETKEVRFSCRYGVLPAPSRTGYSFEGWYLNGEQVTENTSVWALDDHSLIAGWRGCSYNVSFSVGPNAETPSPINVTYGEMYGNLPTPSKRGYLFSGWYLNGRAVSNDTVVAEMSDHVLVAQWTPAIFQIRLEANGGLVTSDVLDAVFNSPYGELPTPSYAKHRFNGWLLNGETVLPDTIVSIPSNHVLVANWIKEITLNFDANGGVGGWSEARDYDSALVAPVVSRVGYTFVGWSPEVPATVPANDATYTAQWRINTHSVTFDANGGTGGTSRKQDYGTAIVVPTVTRTGYTFKGWLPEVAATVPDEDVSYTAQWEANTYTVSFDPNGGNLNGGTASKDVVFDSVYGELPVPVLEFCSFDGWTLGGAAVVPSTKVVTAANHTLVAMWSRWGTRIASDAALTGQTLRELYPDDYANLTTVVIEEGVTELPEGFFDGCDNVENLTLPESLETLGYDELPKKIRESLDYGLDGFMVCQGWVLGYRDDGASALSLPQGVKGIGTRAFAEFWDLETVVIPDTVERIGRSAFFECTFLDEVEIPDSVLTIGKGAFENCSYMQTLSVGTGVRKVADRAFARCASLQAVAFADGLESVGECAFSNAWRMLSVSLPHSVTNIGDGAFAACRRVKGVAVPANVMELADMFPAAYTNIESVVVASGETDIMDDMFNGCAALVDFTWSGSETNVGERAFLGCESLTSVAMPDSVLRIGAEAFKECSSLHDLTLSRSLEALPDFVFEECGALDSFIVPASVTSLGECVVKDAAVSAIYYLGNAPEYDPNAYTDAAAGLVTYVVRGTRGWDGTPSSRVLPEDWIGHEITYWTPNRFDVTFDANGGYFGESSVTQWAEQQITDMGYVLPNQNPVRPGYAFEGWWTESAAGAQVKYSTQVTATRPHSLYAHWRLLGNLVTATFNANGGTADIPGSQSYVAGQTFGEFPVPSRRGYVFCGWWSEAIGGDCITEASKVPEADVELFAHWEPIRYFVAYDANGGTGVMTNQVHVYDVSKELDENLFSRTGYAFSGWAKSGDGQVEYANRAQVVNLAEISDAVVTLYAVWSGAGYNVRFDSNGGTGVMESQTIQIGETQNLHTNAFAFSGREFLGWATESGGIVAYKDGEAVSGLASANGATVHLYAVWRTSDATWRVSFDSNGGSVAPGHWNVARGESLDALPTPTRPGHVFMGWWTRRAGGTSVTLPFAVTGDMSLYAHWRAYDDPLPPVSGDAGVAAIMGDSADLRLAENVKTVGEYDTLVEWADANGIGHQAVRTSLHVWASYVLGAGTLLENEPEIVIGEVGVSGDGVLGTTHPSVTVSVTVKDGGEAIAVDAMKVAAMFEATSDLDDWDGTAKLSVSVEAVEASNVGNGYSMRVQVALPANAERAFLRIRH